MQHGVGREAQPLQRREVVEIPEERHDALRTEAGDVVGAPDEADHAGASVEQADRAHRDVAAADEQDAHHRECGFRARERGDGEGAR